ncbi:unnamed protein product [Lactuca virosa]|uniref:Uncharacterized protein n=1 Tax=Lactuca virosa TaxID=75947 RepID=A0AAU9PE46_9ASTR|nr:unnamed protein product [Lactuca virosa]
MVSLQFKSRSPLYLKTDSENPRTNRHQRPFIVFFIDREREESSNQASNRGGLGGGIGIFRRDCSGNLLQARITSVDNPVLITSSSRALIKRVIPKYFSFVWSLAQFRLVEGSQYIVAFGHQKNTVVILGLDGSFYRCQFDPKTGGEMTQLEYHNFVKPDDSF